MGSEQWDESKVVRSKGKFAAFVRDDNGEIEGMRGADRCGDEEALTPHQWLERNAIQQTSSGDDYQYFNGPKRLRLTEADTWSGGAFDHAVRESYDYPTGENYRQWAERHGVDWESDTSGDGLIEWSHKATQAENVRDFMSDKPLPLGDIRFADDDEIRDRAQAWFDNQVELGHIKYDGGYTFTKTERNGVIKTLASNSKFYDSKFSDTVRGSEEALRGEPDGRIPYYDYTFAIKQGQALKLRAFMRDDARPNEIAAHEFLQNTDMTIREYGDDQFMMTRTCEDGVVRSATVNGAHSGPGRSHGVALAEVMGRARSVEAHPSFSDWYEHYGAAFNDPDDAAEAFTRAEQESHELKEFMGDEYHKQKYYEN